MNEQPEQPEQAVSPYLAVTPLMMGAQRVQPGQPVPMLPSRDYQGMLARGEITYNPAARHPAPTAEPAAPAEPAGPNLGEVKAGDRVYVVRGGQEDEGGTEFWPAVVEAVNAEAGSLRVTQVIYGTDEPGPTVDVPLGEVVGAQAAPAHGLLVMLSEQLAEAQAAQGTGEGTGEPLPEGEALGDDEREQWAAAVDALRARVVSLLNATGEPLGREGGPLAGEPRIVEHLLAGGYATDDAVQFATDEELNDLPGIAEKSVARIRAVLPHEDAEPEAEPEGEGSAEA